MRKTNKKLAKLAADKYGVILVTVIFIVAMALVFITTALTISIATRQRVYSNAKYQQARLTVTSLAQSVWQAIYSQQISDRDLVALAKGTGGNGTLVSFSNNDVPGMGLGGTVATAYFYCVTPGDPSKIGIEFKCDIDGATDGVCQYYTMVLERHKGEDFPPSAFHLPVNLGEAGTLDSVNIGLNASYITDNDRHNQVRFDADDNICFLHNPVTSTAQDGSGFYCHLICDGMAFFQNSVYAWDAYFLQRDSAHPAGYNFDGGASSTDAATRGLTGNPATASNNQWGDLYFWGTDRPFSYAGLAPSSNAFELRGINDIYLDYREDDSGNRVGFAGLAGNTFISQNFQELHGDIHYEDISITPAGGGATWVSHSAGWDPVVTNGMDSYLNVSAEEMDTIDEVVAKYNGELATATTITSLSAITGSGAYVLDGSSTNSYYVESNVSLDVSGGEILIFLTNGANLYIGESNVFVKITGSGNHKVVFLLCDGSVIHIGTGRYGARTNTGIVDTACFPAGATSYPVNTVNQTTNPRCYILSEYTGGWPVQCDGNNQMVLTASLGFFPQSTPDAGGGGRVFFYNANNTNTYYGRISAGGIDTGSMGAGGSSGGNLNVPYCPPENDGGTVRTYAYRDNTDFSVVQDECMYFTA